MSAQSSWPNLFIVGTAKSGTTSLSRYLGEHPEIFMTHFKEPHFFSGHRPSRAPFVHDEGDYLRLFADARTRLRGEASPSYLWAEPAAARIKRVSPEAKILISLRDPVERSHSYYWHRVRRGLECRSFAAAVSDEFERGWPKERPSLGWHMKCAHDVRRFFELFGANVRVILFEELIRDVRRELEGVFAFLAVDPTHFDPDPRRKAQRVRGSAWPARSRSPGLGPNAAGRPSTRPLHTSLVDRAAPSRNAAKAADRRRNGEDPG